MPPSESVSNAPTNRWRFGLRTMLLIMFIVGLTVALVVQSQRLWKADQELTRLRDETGRLTVNDRSKIHVIAVDTDEPNTWKWRMFIPKGLKYSWNVTYGQIPAAGMPRSKMSGSSNESYDEVDKEVLVTASLHQMADGDWRLLVSPKISEIRAQMAGASLKIPDAEMEWTRKVPSREGSVLGSRGAETIDSGKPIVFVKWRSGELKPDGTFGPAADPMPGYMIWMEPQ